MKPIILIPSLLILILAPFFGQASIDLMDLSDKTSMSYQIFWELRVPRILLAFAVGAILSLSGLIFQTLFRNPMSTPFTLGVASGATLFTAIAIMLGLTLFSPLFAFMGATLTIILLFIITARFDSDDNASLLLVGIALSFFYSAALLVLFFLSSLQESYEIVRFTMGSLDIVGFDNAALMSVVALLLLLLIYHYRYELRILLTSYAFAHLKGIRVKQLNTILLLGVSIAVGVAVSITGPIGFVGLIIPHILKTIYAKSADRLIFPIFFYGGIFLVLCDTIARNLGTSSDVPIGVVTSFLGAPFFIYLIMNRKRRA
jgi:iron complex transport system permease protein